MRAVAASEQRSAREAPRVGLRAPSLALLDAYAEAMRDGWSPNNSRDVTAEYLTRIEDDPGAFIAWLLRPGEIIRLADGAQVPRLPDRLRWIVALDQPGEPLVGSICAGRMAPPPCRSMCSAISAIRCCRPIAAAAMRRRGWP